MNALEDQYQRCCWGRDAETSLKMRPYLPTLKLRASKVRHATEFGFNMGFSATAILAGLPRGGILNSYDIRAHPMGYGLLRWANDEGKDFHFHHRSSLDIEIVPTEMLFIDSLHTADQLGMELLKHKHQVVRYLVLHDTAVHWEEGENGGRGLRGPIEHLMSSGEWKLTHQEDHGCGMMVFVKE